MKELYDIMKNTIVDVVYVSLANEELYGRVYFPEEDECFLVEIDNTLTYNEIVGTLAHEFAHIIEHIQGREFEAHGIQFYYTEKKILKIIGNFNKKCCNLQKTGPCPVPGSI